MKKEYRELANGVFPSLERTLSVIKEDEYDGAHVYYAKNCTGYENGHTKYVTTEQQIRFVKKDKNGTITPGLQSEQLAYILLDRTQKLNAKYPSAQNEQMVKGLLLFLDACKSRVQDRVSRGVMGKLEK